MPRLTDEDYDELVPDDDPEIIERMRRLAELRAAEDGIPEIGVSDRSR